MTSRDSASFWARGYRRKGIRRWLARCEIGAAIWVELDQPPDAQAGHPPAEIVAHVATGGGSRSLRLALCEPHPRKLAVDAAAVDELRALCERAAPPAE